MICKEKISTYLCILILFAAFATGLAVTPDYGIPTDENTEIGILLSNVREYLSLYFDDESQVMYKLDEQNYLPISQTREIDHGEAAFYPLSPFLYLAKTGTIDVSRHTVSIVYHCYTYLVCFSAVVAAFVMVNDLFKNRYLALICAFIMLVSPRIFAEMHYNNKDMVLFALIADVCCLGMLAIKYCKPHQVVLFSFCSAVAANTKVIGVFAYGVVGLSFIVYTTVYKEWGDRCRIKAVISAILMFCAFYYVLTPAMWKDIPGFFDYSLFNAFRFSRWGGKVHFEGQLLSPSEGELPGRYLIKLIF